MPTSIKPAAIVELEPGYWSGGHFYEGTKGYIPQSKIQDLPAGTELYTKECLQKASENFYNTAEFDLILWVEKYSKAGLSIPELVYMMQFRIFDINVNTREHFFESQKPLEDVNKDEHTNNPI